MLWGDYIKDFQNYLKLERSFSSNSVEAYIRDINKLQQFLELKGETADPFHLSPVHIHDFLEYITELGLSANSQARILSGIKAFYRYLFYIDDSVKDPTELIEGPKLGRNPVIFQKLLKIVKKSAILNRARNRLSFFDGLMSVT
jgi:integrase/recombinase XerD